MHTVAVLVFDPVAVFETAVACEVFGLDRQDMGVPRYRFVMCTPEPGSLLTKGGGFSMVVDRGLGALRQADTIICPSWSFFDIDPPKATLNALVAAHRRGARIVSFCSGAFVLAAAGLLDHRRVATHWMHATALAARYPAIDVDPSVLYIDDGSGVFTSAGTAAAIDLCLHLVRLDHGADIANVVARRMVMPPHRDGGQAQYVEAPLASTADSDPLRPTLDWAVAHLDEDLTVERMARKARMSPRTFARRFRSTTGTTPLQWLLSQRVIAAQRLLESSDLPIEQVSNRCGFGSAATLRMHFGRVVGTTPQTYRRQFKRSA
ncbi:MAG: helix-turn-helix domain-containing protein [Acidimicrobiales bacterium]